MNSPTVNLIFAIIGVVVAIWGTYILARGPRKLQQLMAEEKLPNDPERIRKTRIVGWSMIVFGVVIAAIDGWRYFNG